MARIRGIKPEFFMDEDLACLSLEARLFFIGLWCYADKAGRLEDRPKYLKAEIFPYDKIDVEKLLLTLAQPNLPDRPDKVFIRRYEVNGRKYIDIPEFSRHQSFHKTEKESTLPVFNGYLTVKEPLSNGCITQEKEKEKEKEKECVPHLPPKTKFLDSVFLTADEYTRLKEAMGQKNLDRLIEQLDYSITVKSGKYKDHNKTLLNWFKRGYHNNGNGRHAEYSGGHGPEEPDMIDRALRGEI